MPADNVRELRPRDPDAQPITRRRPPKAKRFCPHHHVEVDERHRELVCQDCGSDVDPFDFLSYMAHSIDKYTEYTARAKRDAEHAERELADVKRRLRNAKAQLRRREPTVPCGLVPGDDRG